MNPCKRKIRISHPGHLLGKALLICLVVFFLVMGILGILLPIIPGILFLIIAGVLAARVSPAVAWCLGQNRFGARCLDISNRFFELNLWDQVRVCFWGSLKITVDSTVWLFQKSKSLFVKLT